MKLTNRGSEASPKNADAPLDPSKARAAGNLKGKPAPRTGSGGWIAMAAVAGLLIGAGGGYLVASSQFNDQVTAISQASELRVSAANQRIEELQAQQREFAQQVDRQQQEIVQQADEQQRKIVSQVGEQERALLAQAKERERDLAKPDLPVRVWVRRAQLGGALVGQVHNFGAKELALTVTARNGATNKQNIWHTVLAPSATQVIGGEPGWGLAAGDEIALDGDGFRPISFPVRPHARPTQISKE